ncbi:DUF1698 domain-containing protein [Natronorarus salvus]|uniref:DUF1698 domain-containing protein n=1 Tax=Natronorarus salvus TaxID=3117733 RepID=UPI002F268D08
MSTTSSPGSVWQYDAPSWLVIAFGLCLGSIGIGYQIVHPEPPAVWLFEVALVVVPAAVVVYGGYWIATRPLDRENRWLIAGLTVGGAVVADAVIGGYILTEQFGGETVGEPGRLALLGALGGSVVALFATVPVQRRSLGIGGGLPSSDPARATGTVPSPTMPEDEGSDTGSRLPFGRLVARAIEIQRQEGVRSLLGSTRGAARVRLARTGLVHRRPYHERKRTDSDDRWEMIAPHVSATDSTALDIGCASGFFTAKLAGKGLLSIGIDGNRERLRTAKRLWGDEEGVGFVRYTLGSEDVATLPTFDVVLLLTVYHHWCSQFGREGAERALRELATRTETLFFEPPGEGSGGFHRVTDRPLADDESIVEYYTELLRTVFDDEVGVEYLGEAAYPSNRDRTDPVFLLDCRGYTGSRSEG